MARSVSPSPIRSYLQPFVRSGFENKRSAKPRPLLKPRPRGATEQHLADAPFRERGPSTASVAQGSCGPGWSFLRKQNLTLARRSDCRRGRLQAEPQILLIQISISRTVEACRVADRK